MKDFLKTTLAAIIGTSIALGLCFFLIMGIIGSVASLAESPAPVIPSQAILKIDFANPITEIGHEDPVALLSPFSQTSARPLSILKAIQAIDRAAEDPAIRFIYINISRMNAGISNLEEIRSALERFRKAGKAIIAYGDNYSQGAYYLASVADKIYMNNAGHVQIMGLSSNMMFFKDLLDKLGIQVQLIRHGKFKAAAEQFISPGISAENLEQNKVMLTSIWDSWAEEICRSRSLDKARFNGMVDHLELSNTASMLENGLVDAAVSRDEMTRILCTLFDAKDENQLQVVSLADYAHAAIHPQYKIKDKIAVIMADGEITMDAPDGLAASRYYPIIRNAAKDSSVKAVVLRVNSPGGDAQAAEILRKELELLKMKKPLIVSMGDYAASGGYWISAVADKIFTNNTTITGSIGVFSLSANVGKGLKEQLHINHVAINSNAHSDLYNGMDPLDSFEIAHMQGMVEDIYTDFTNLVAEGRSLPESYVDSIGQGRVWTGADAIARRLADERGGLFEAISSAAAMAGLDQYQLCEFPKAKTTLEQLMEALSGTSTAVKAMADPQQALREAYSGIMDGNGAKVYARHPFCYEFRY